MAFHSGLSLYNSTTARVRRKCFISYHHADQAAVDQFIRDFDHEHDTFISRGLGKEMTDDIINSNNPEYVMRRIRDLFLADSTVTIVLMGRCTWARRYVDWEIQASLRRGEQAIRDLCRRIRDRSLWR